MTYFHHFFNSSSLALSASVIRFNLCIPGARAIVCKFAIVKCYQILRKIVRFKANSGRGKPEPCLAGHASRSAFGRQAGRQASVFSLLFFVIPAPVPNFENDKIPVIFVNFVNNPVSVAEIISHLPFISAGELVSYVRIDGKFFY